MEPQVLKGIGSVLEIILNMFQILIVASVLVNLLGADQSNRIVQIITSATEPMYRPIRRFTRNIPGPIDWAPLAIWLAIVFVQIAFVRPMIRG